jgi:hypothetical protein
MEGEDITKIPPRKVWLPYQHGDGYFGPKYVISSYAHTKPCIEAMNVIGGEE